MREALISAFKRDSRRDILLAYFEEIGCTECVEEVNSQKIVTNALIDRTFKMLNDRVIEVELEEGTDDGFDDKPTLNTDTDGSRDGSTDDSDSSGTEGTEGDIRSTIEGLKKAISKGKRKKAKKLLKQVKALGVSGSEIDKLAQQVKEL